MTPTDYPPVINGIVIAGTVTLQRTGERKRLPIARSYSFAFLGESEDAPHLVTVDGVAYLVSAIEFEYERPPGQ